MFIFHFLLEGAPNFSTELLKSRMGRTGNNFPKGESISWYFFTDCRILAISQYWNEISECLDDIRLPASRSSTPPAPIITFLNTFLLCGLLDYQKPIAWHPSWKTLKNVETEVDMENEMKLKLIASRPFCCTCCGLLRLRTWSDELFEKKRVWKCWQKNRKVALSSHSIPPNYIKVTRYGRKVRK